MEDEVWKEIPDTNGEYQASSQGRVRRVDTGNYLEPYPLIGGYLGIALGVDGKTVQKRLHLLVLEAFRGPQPTGKDAVFSDGNKANCFLTNLDWGTRKKEGGRSKTEVGDEVGHFEAVADRGYPEGSHVKHWQVRCMKCDSQYVVQGQAFREGRCKCDKCDYPLFQTVTTIQDVREKPTKEIREYKKWLDMKNRCNNRPEYRNAGVTVCECWDSDFVQFFTDVGPQPGPDYSVDRWPDTKGNYEPGNVRWATPRQQNENRSWSSKPAVKNTL